MTTDKAFDPNCGHNPDEFLLVATTGNPLEGGIAVCPTCTYWFTWSVSGRPSPTISQKYGDLLARMVLAGHVPSTDDGDKRTLSGTVTSGDSDLRPRDRDHRDGGVDGSSGGQGDAEADHAAQEDGY